MKKFFSKKWIGSTQPRKQRKYRSNAPLHIKRKLLAAHVSKALRKEINKRSMVVRKGDEVMVMRGEFRGKKGVVSDVSLRKSKILIDSIKRKKVSGQEVMVPTDPSNIQITKLSMEDKMRRRIVGRIHKTGLRKEK
ncbi:MAG: 50S ribosomal protein L24 [Candidatus Aenigmarchaeota archaeon]|nr:50S ribosomal protein L24 [Candidatus Aenigmarchaeota archaeon]